MMTDARHAIRARIGHVATAAGGFAALVVLVLAYFAMHGALRNLAYATVIWPATQYHAVNRVPFGLGTAKWLAASWGYGGTSWAAFPEPS